MEELRMASPYDLVVIGTGTAASVAAYRCRDAGWRVAVIDHLPFGGTCAQRGCDPKKVLVGAAETADQDRRMRGKGIAGGEPVIDWQSLMAFKRSFTVPVPQRREAEFAEAGIDAFHGRARFRGTRMIEVAGESLEARFILIATGAVPMHLGIPGEEHLATSTDFLDLDVLPKRIVLVGGGYIAAEFSHIAARADATVTVLEQTDRILPQFDQALVGWLREKSAALGIDLRLGTRVERIDKAGTGFQVTINAHGVSGSVEGDLVVHAAGRVPDLEPLDLDSGGIAREKGRLKLNGFLQSTSKPAVYAAGDAASSGPPLTPVASHDARTVAANMLEGNHAKSNYTGVPSIVFTTPPLTRVGLLEEDARRQGLRFRVNHEKTADWYTARRIGEECAGYKVLIEEATDRILGAHLIGPHADEVINIFAMAIRNGLTAEQVGGMIFGYPTATSDVSYMI